MVGENVNYVNASFIAEDRGIKVVESKATQTEEFSNLIELVLKGKGSELTLQGTLSSRREARVVKIDHYVVEAIPYGYLLVIKNHDKPGLIGNLGTLLGKSDINIAGMTNGRDKPGGEAITVVNVDSEIAADVVNKVKQFTHVKVEGIMTILPYYPPEETRPFCKQMFELKKKLGVKTLSMGMSNDFEIAVEEGSDMVRIGTAIFGQRIKH